MKNFLLASLLLVTICVGQAAPFVNDTFTGADTTLLTSHTGETGATWTFQTAGGAVNAMKIINNRVYYDNTTTFATYFASGSSPTNDYDVWTVLRFLSSGNSNDIFLRAPAGVAGSASNWYQAHVGGASVTLIRVIAGTNVTIGTASYSNTIGNDIQLRLQAVGSQIRVYVDGEKLLDITDSNHATGRFVGLFANGPGTTTPATQGRHYDLFGGGPNLLPGTTSASATGTTTVTASSTAATGDTGTYSIQWQRAPDASGVPGTWADVGSPQTGITLGVAPTNLSDTGLTAATIYWYRGKLTYSDGSWLMMTTPGSVTTNSGASLASGTASASSITSTTATLTVGVATGGTSPYTYQWYRSSSPGFTPGGGNILSGQTSTTHNATGLTASTTYYYKCVVTDNVAATATSNEVTVTTSGAGLAATVTATATQSSTVKLTITAPTGGTAPYSIQWQQAPDSSGSPGTFVSIYTATSYANAVVPPPAYVGGLTAATPYHFRAIVIDSAGSPVTLNTSPSSVTTSASRAASTRYISSAGNDSNNGTATGTPWLTLEKASDYGFVPGDQLYLNGGNTFSGNLFLVISSIPTQSTPIIIGSYGTGRATIDVAVNSGYSTFGIRALNASFTTIKDLIVRGPGITVIGTYPSQTATNTSGRGRGVLLENVTQSTHIVNTILDNLLIFDLGLGVSVQSGFPGVPTAGFDGLRINGCEVHDCLTNGIAVSGYTVSPYPRINRNISVTNCTTYNFPGETATVAGSGYPIVIFGAQDSLIENCLTYNVGYAQNAGATNGTSGPFFAHSTRCTIRFVECYGARGGPNQKDGGGPDLDADCINCVVEYCYAHDNDGEGMLLWEEDGGSALSSGNIVRYNIFVNNGLGTTTANASGLKTTPQSGTALVHNNIWWQDGGVDTRLIDAQAGGICNFYNNVFAIGGTGKSFGTINASTLVGNVFWAFNGATFSITTNTGTYTSIAALRAAGYEVSGGINFGASGDPKFRTPNFSDNVMPAALTSMNAYDIIDPTSAAQGVGVDLVRFSLLPPAYDWHGNRAKGVVSSTLNGNDAGATRFNSVEATGGSTGTTMATF